MRASSIMEGSIEEETKSRAALLHSVLQQICWNGYNLTQQNPGSTSIFPKRFSLVAVEASKVTSATTLKVTTCDGISLMSFKFFKVICSGYFELPWQRGKKRISEIKLNFLGLQFSQFITDKY